MKNLVNSLCRSLLSTPFRCARCCDPFNGFVHSRNTKNTVESGISLNYCLVFHHPWLHQRAAMFRMCWGRPSIPNLPTYLPNLDSCKVLPITLQVFLANVAVSLKCLFCHSTNGSLSVQVIQRFSFSILRHMNFCVV